VDHEIHPPETATGWRNEDVQASAVADFKRPVTCLDGLDAGIREHWLVSCEGKILSTNSGGTPKQIGSVRSMGDHAAGVDIVPGTMHCG
jgi:hypothetical protein